MVATQLAGRGIDIPNLKYVINYDMPLTIQEYVHRIGRTGRAGTQGYAFSLIGREDSQIYIPLMRLLEESGAEIPEAVKNNALGTGAFGRESLRF